LTAKAGALWPAAGEISGRDAVLAQFASIFATFENSLVIAEDYIEHEGDVVVVPSLWRGTLGGSDRVIEQRLVAVYRLRDGLIAQIGYFAGLNEALEGLRRPLGHAQIRPPSVA
jgi:ketosteroid isomerase-like protein